MGVAYQTEILDGGLGAIAAVPDLPPAAWPNTKPEKPWPPAEGFWLEVRWFPNESEDPFWDSDGQQRAMGFFQVLVVGRVDEGVGIYDEAVRIAGALPKGTAFGPVAMHKPGVVSPQVDDGDRIYVPIRLHYDGFVR